MVELASILTPNRRERRELERLLGIPSLPEWGFARRLVCLAETWGEGGARLYTPEGAKTLPALPAQVVDTTGAGDIFGGSAMSRFLKLNKAPDGLTVDEMEAVTRFACCAASLSTQTHGGIFSVVPEEQVLSIL